MQLSSESLEISNRPKVLIEAVQILLPIAMVSLAIASVLGQIFDNGRDPNLDEFSKSYDINRGKSSLTAEKPMPWI